MKWRKGNLVAIGLGVIVAAIVVASVALPMIQPLYTLNDVVNETFNLTATQNSTGHVLTNTPVDTSGLTVYHGTNSTVDQCGGGDQAVCTASTLTAVTEYNITYATGNMTFFTLGNYTVSYSWQPSGYLTSSLNRTVATYVPTFLILALLIMAGAAFLGKLGG